MCAAAAKRWETLRGAGHDLSKSDEEAKTELEKLKVEYEDIEPVGGQAKEE